MLMREIISAAMTTGTLKVLSRCLMSMNVTDGLFVRDGCLTGYGGISTLAYDLLLKNAVIIIPFAIGI